MFVDHSFSVTWIECVPLIFSACVDYMSASDSWSHLRHLRVWSCIGAPFQIAPARTAAKFLPDLQFYNSYAPTENCLVTTMHRLTEAELASLANVRTERLEPNYIFAATDAALSINALRNTERLPAMYTWEAMENSLPLETPSVTESFSLTTDPPNVDNDLPNAAESFTLKPRSTVIRPAVD